MLSGNGKCDGGPGKRNSQSFYCPSYCLDLARQTQMIQTEDSIRLRVVSNIWQQENSRASGIHWRVHQHPRY